MREIGFTIVFVLGSIAWSYVLFLYWRNIPSIRGKVLYSGGTVMGLIMLSIGLAVPLSQINISFYTVLFMSMGIAAVVWVVYLIQLALTVFRVKRLNAASRQLKEEGKTDKAIAIAMKALSYAVRAFIHTTEYWESLDWSHIKEDIDETWWEKYFSDDTVHPGWKFLEQIGRA